MGDQNKRVFRANIAGRELLDRVQELWDELVSGCLAEQVTIDRAELGRWLADSGWEQEADAVLADRFFADSEWLAKHLAVMAP